MTVTSSSCQKVKIAWTLCKTGLHTPPTLHTFPPAACPERRRKEVAACCGKTFPRFFPTFFPKISNFMRASPPHGSLPKLVPAFATPSADASS
jgi:hypothetical protein